MKLVAFCFAAYALLMLGLLALYAQPILHAAHLLNATTP